MAVKSLIAEKFVNGWNITKHSILSDTYFELSLHPLNPELELKMRSIDHKRKVIFKLLIVSSVLGIAGCSSAPSCSDPVVKQLVGDLADKYVGLQMGSEMALMMSPKVPMDPSKYNFHFEGIRTTGTDKKKDLVKCAANLRLQYEGVSYSQRSVVYTAQPSDDGKEVWVEARFSR
jgi:hypothetical protein